jgi:hypothetical protein
MSKAKLFVSLFAILLVYIGQTNLTNASNLADKDNPMSFSGEILPWGEADKLIPKGSKFTVIDVDTGHQFKVQRRAGSRHADVQPLSEKDTKIMKEIYKGSWSWKRRSIFVLVGDQLLAASMHGMPHGAGALQNGFPGHFCIHFWGSTTHKSKHSDLAHKLMILKAGGKLENYLRTLGPEEVIYVFETAINNKDEHILDLTVTETKPNPKIHKVLQEISIMKISDIKTSKKNIDSDYMITEIPVKAKFYFKNNKKETKTVLFVLEREGSALRWRIDADYLLSQLDA